jgi:glycosyltransferase involved in cell wall biosynthesis
MKISVIIPTRERAQYLHYSIQTALRIDDAEIEIIVCDNASQDGTADVVAAFDDRRLKYVNTGQRISMRENFNFALNASSGEYVIFFGDDDGILPGQFKFLRQLLEKYRPDGMSWNRLTYGWPVDGYGKKTGGVRLSKHSVFGTPYIYDPKERNLTALMDCALNSMTPVTPNVYHGCVSRAYLNRLALAPNMYFDSSIPDVNFEYRATMTGANFLHANHPFTINGYSPASTGGAHHGARADKEGGKAGRAFTTENKVDTVKDVFDHALTVPLAFFSTLETVITRMGYSDRKPNYENWYHYGLSAEPNNVESSAKIEQILGDYAKQSGTVAEFKAAKSAPPKPKRTFKQRVQRVGEQIHSLRVSTEQDGENTILSASQVCDELLGDTFGETPCAKRQWSAAKHRSKFFRRQL